MNFSLIVAHPDSSSFNHAIADTAMNSLKSHGVNVYYHDLYQESFPAVLPVEEISRDASLPQVITDHCEEIRSVDGIIIVHPNWWGQPPAILKGWVDRVMRPGVTYRFVENDKGEGVPEGLLKARIAIVFNTSNTYPQREQDIFGDPLELIWKNCVFGLCGVTNFYRKTFATIVNSTIEQRHNWLNEVEHSVTAIINELNTIKDYTREYRTDKNGLTQI